MLRYVSLPARSNVSHIRSHKRSFCTSSSAEESIKVQDHGNAKVLTLNRPKVLNAVNLDMIRKLTPHFQDPSSKVIILKGEGKAFCAGGDIRAVWEATKERKFGPGELTHTFFNEEYQLNHLMSQRKAIQVSILNGITMGGGVGLSIHGKYRVATKNTAVAMPETRIGFFPDVGASWAFNQLTGPDNLGLYLALTGNQIKGQDLIMSGIATHLVEESDLNELEKNLVKCSSEFEVTEVLDRFHTMDEDYQSDFKPYAATIEEAFQAYSYQDIPIKLMEMAKRPELSDDIKKWLHQQHFTLSQMSPIALEVTFGAFRFGAISDDLEEALKREFALSQAIIRSVPDFVEGIRAQLIDKDRKPQWSQAGISDHDVFRLFEQEHPWSPLK
eukprot:TRINITY_DN1225_c0_g1_i1.p1 TRINITY_DN1225_c0_g1~~TRINITY_DN1225_c0_g1_i1.p1  ORF type:complete len:386 (+),score=80.10 TRINITY_DN1225_c0_g1_i1:36-1193(+)